MIFLKNVQFRFTIDQRAGSAKAVNIALMGCLSTYYPDIPEEAWLQAMEAVVPEKFLELNKKAFALGRA